jgi:hypothetical protein
MNAGGRWPEVRTQYILEGDSRKAKGRLMLMRDVLVTDPKGRQSVAVTVTNTVAMDVLEALRAAYQQGREDLAEERENAEDGIPEPYVCGPDCNRLVTWKHTPDNCWKPEPRPAS